MAFFAPLPDLHHAGIVLHEKPHRFPPELPDSSEFADAVMAFKGCLWEAHTFLENELLRLFEMIADTAPLATGLTKRRIGPFFQHHCLARFSWLAGLSLHEVNGIGFIEDEMPNVLDEVTPALAVLLYDFIGYDPRRLNEPDEHRIPIRQIDQLLFLFSCHSEKHLIRVIFNPGYFFFGQAAGTTPERRNSARFASLAGARILAANLAVPFLKTLLAQIVVIE